MNKYCLNQDLQHPRLGKSSRGLQFLDTRMGFPSPYLNVVLDSISLISMCLTLWGETTFLHRHFAPSIL